MIRQIYIEEDIRDHPRTAELIKRHPRAQIISCDHFGEVFNPRSQNFRLQKNNPALILARKTGKRVLPAPPGYAVGGDTNYYFSHMMNCPYDCRYCFLQGMYPSAHYVLFVNYEDFMDDIRCIADEQTSQSPWFFSGYDCDSLAYEPISRFSDSFLPFFQTVDAFLELRTKSTQIRRLLSRKPMQNIVVAYSLSPDPVTNALEHRTPSLQKRLDALLQLQQHGWPVGLRFDPLIYDPDYQSMYQKMFDQVFCALDCAGIHSVSLGTFRMPKGFFNKMSALYPAERLFAGPLGEDRGMIMYDRKLENEMIDFCSEQILRHVRSSQFFPCVLDE